MRIATRGSTMAVAQTDEVIRQLLAKHPQLATKRGSRQLAGKAAHSSLNCVIGSERVRMTQRCTLSKIFQATKKSRHSCLAHIFAVMRSQTVSSSDLTEPKMISGRHLPTLQ
jgi:hypothetical protein